MEDQFGNLDTAFNGSVTVALDNNPGNATLGGTTTLNASGGVAAFSGLTINVIANDYTLVATDATASPHRPRPRSTSRRFRPPDWR